MTDFLSEHYLPWIIGFGFSVLVAWPLIKWASYEMWRAVDLGPTDRPSRWQPVALGLVERPLFTAALLTGNAEFIAVWLALKTAASWSSWGVDHPGAMTTRTISGREVYVNFMLAQALSIGFAAAGAYSVTLVEDQRLAPALLLMAATATGTAALAWWIRREGRANLSTEPRRQVEDDRCALPAQATTGTERVHEVRCGALQQSAEPPRIACSHAGFAARCTLAQLARGEKMSDDAKFILGFG